MKNPPQSRPDPQVLSRRQLRMLKDSAARYGVAIGGVGVIIAIVLIFFYLLYVVFPLFVPASAEEEGVYGLPGDQARTLYLAMDETADAAARFLSNGTVVFFSTKSGEVVKQVQLEGVAGTEVVSLAEGSPATGTVLLGLADGRALVVRHKFEVSFPGDVRTVTPAIEYPYGSEPLPVDEAGQPLLHVAMSDGDDQLTLAAATAAGRYPLVRFAKETNFLTGTASLERHATELNPGEAGVEYLLIEPNQQRLYAGAGDGNLWHFDIRDQGAPRLVEKIRLVEGDSRVTSLRFLNGGQSLLVGTSSGQVAQWFPVRDGGGEKLRKIRQFEGQTAPIRALAAEQRRRGFLAADASGSVGIYHSTAGRNLLIASVSVAGARKLAVAPRADAMIVESADGRLHFWRIHNEHPEISWSALWEKVWYEGYSEPLHIWQSSSVSNDFEPKFSLTPLAFGTLKAAFYAMLLAMPLAIFGAIYTAYFMAPRMRRMVKPTIEIMEALPTVILGFLAGLWLAPTIERDLPGVFAILLLMPLGLLLFAYLWRHLPRQVRGRVPEGWEPALLIPVVIFIGWGALALSMPLEQWLFGGDMRVWLSRELGVNFDQRNSVVIGIAMGFAVIPTIFSITEDAIFSVPKHLTNGSLALGATPWQTLIRVVILTASPGIFSAVMIGLGRAVGETMIVLMATGNTPVMDFSIFQGMRTLSANIAVEMPESEVGSTHYRILFLAALVLFVFTFMFNTAAELVRHRLRRKYSNL